MSLSEHNRWRVGSKKAKNKRGVPCYACKETGLCYDRWSDTWWCEKHYLAQVRGEQGTFDV
jgi:hypothetical protein